MWEEEKKNILRICEFLFAISSKKQNSSFTVWELMTDPIKLSQMWNYRNYNSCLERTNSRCNL